MEQGTPEWFEARGLRMTGSKAQAIGNAGKGLETLCWSLVASSVAETGESYTNPDIERGNELEEVARSLFELETGKRVEEVGFVEYNEFVGASPDGLIVDEDAGLEIKCPNNERHFKVLVQGLKAVDSKYLWQCQQCMLVTGRKKWYFVSYNPNFGEDSLVILEVHADKEKHDKLLAGFKKGEELIKSITSQYEKRANSKDD